MKEIDRNSPLTLTYQLTMILRADIQDGKYPPESLIPGESELMKIYDISRVTVRNALDVIVQDGLVHRLRGKGTFVSKKKLISDITFLKSTTRLFQELGIKSEIQLLSIEKITPSQFIQSQLMLKEDEKVYQLKRLRLANGDPTIFETNFLPEKFFPNLETQDFSRSLYEIFDSTYHIRLIRSREKFTSMVLDKKTAGLLNCKKGDHAIKMRGNAYIAENILTSYEECVYRGDRFEIFIDADAERPRGQRFIPKS